MDAPGLIVRSSSDTAADEDDLRLHEHLLAGREDGTIRDHEVLNDLRVGDNTEELVAEPHGVERAELFSPLVESHFRVASQERESACVDAYGKNAPRMTVCVRDSPRMGRPQGPGGRFWPLTLRVTNLNA